MKKRIARLFQNGKDRFLGIYLLLEDIIFFIGIILFFIIIAPLIFIVYNYWANMIYHLVPINSEIEGRKLYEELMNHWTLKPLSYYKMFYILRELESLGYIQSRIVKDSWYWSRSAGSPRRKWSFSLQPSLS